MASIKGYAFTVAPACADSKNKLPPCAVFEEKIRPPREGSLRAEERRTVVFVTNNIEEAIYLGDRVVIMSALPGRVKADYVIDIPRPRNYTDRAFLHYRKRISDDTDLAL